MDHDLPDREEIACALEVVESRLARQGQYDQAVDVFAAARLLRLADDEIARLTRERDEAVRVAVWAAKHDAKHRVNVRRFIDEDNGSRLIWHQEPSWTAQFVEIPKNSTDADLYRALVEACEGGIMDDVLKMAARHVKQCSCKTDWRRPDGYKGKCLDCECIQSLAAEVRALRADLVWAVRGYVRPIDDGQRLAIGIDPQTLFTRMVEWDGTDADILRAIREDRLPAAKGE